jgi:O-antigen/teichoic acid export membrane protein
MLSNRLFGHAAIYTMSNFAVAGVPFLLLPVLTRVLDPAAYGVIAMFSLVVAFMSVGVGLNIHGAITVRYFDKSNFDIPKYVSTALIILAFSTGLMFAFVYIAGAKIAEITSIPMEWLYAAVLVAFLQFLVQILLALWQASKKPIPYGALRISHALLDAIGSILLVVVLALSWQGRLSGMLAAWFLTAMIAVYFLIRESWLAKTIDLAYAKDALSYGLPLVPHAVGGMILGLADRFMVNSVLDVSSTGIYALAVQLGLILGILTESINKAFAPWLMERLININYESQKKIVTFTYIYFVAIISLAAVGSIIVPYILPFIVGPQFQTAGPLLVYILFGNAFTGMYYMVTNYIFYSRRTGLLSKLTISVGVMTAGISWYLINAYGVRGAAIGFMLGQASLFLGAWILSTLCVPMPWFNPGYLFIKHKAPHSGNRQ